MKFPFSIAFINLILTTSFAQSLQVVKLKGSTSFIKNKQSIPLIKNNIYQGPGEVETGKKSYVILKIEGRDRIIVGPESNFNLFKLNKKSPVLLSLLKGKIRAKVKKGRSGKHKMFLKTRSASLGIRGTDFVLIYNPKNNITSNITLSGQVDFYKKSDDQIINSLKEDLDSDNRANHKASEYRFILDDLAKNSVRVKEGTFSGAFPTYDNALSATKLSPDQLKALKGSSFTSNSKRKIIHKSYNNKKFKLTNKNLIPEPKGPSNQDKQPLSKGVRPGGVLDLETGIYVMPPEGSRFNERLGVYELPKDYGGVDSVSGGYIPPENIELDPYLGFVSVVGGVKKQIDQFTKGVTKLFQKYKDVTRVDLYADTRYFYSFKSYENYYGELRNISNAESMILDFEGNIGRHLYNNQRYLHYLKGGLQLVWHNRRDEPLVQRNDRLYPIFGYEFHRKHLVLGRKASFVTDLTFETIYQDHNNKDQWDFYSESSNLRIYELFQTSRKHSIKLGAKLTSFQGHIDRDHGNIYEVFLDNKISPNIHYSFDLNIFKRVRLDRVDNNEIDMGQYELGATKHNLFRKTDLQFKYVYNTIHHEKEILIKKAHFNKLKIQLLRRKGEHFKLHAFYEFLDHNSEGGSENRDFIQQLWGAGLKFIF
jgi:hypothetical protein